MNIFTKKKIFILVSILGLIFINATLLFFNYNFDKNKDVLKVAFLDIGQGDAIFIESPNKVQVLIGSGSGGQIIRSLSKEIPFYDKEIDIVVSTHSDADHVGGIPDILSRYKVKNYIDNGVEDSDDLNTEIQNKISIEPDLILGKRIARRGDKIILDEYRNIYLEILWPIPEYKSDENNNYSIVIKLTYGEINFLLTGDAPSEIEQVLIKNDLLEKGEYYLKSEVLKLGHHGSKTSTSENFLKQVSPDYAVISAGKDNKFGHPNAEVIKILNDFNSETKSLEIKNTAEEGNIVFKTNGKNLWSYTEK